jgi:excisionase family DNA binding protein
VHRTTVYELLAKGEVRSLLIGRARRIPRWMALEFVDRQLEEGL